MVHVDQLFAAFTDFSGSVAKAVAEGKYREIDKARLVFRTFCVKHGLAINFEIPGDKEQSGTICKALTEDDKIKLQASELETGYKVAEALSDMIVTHDYPARFKDYETVLGEYLVACKANGREW